MATTKITNPELFDLGSLNTALKLPSGTTAERPTSPSTGEWRYNTTTNLVEFYDGGAWRDLQSEDIPPVGSENFNVVLYTGTGAAQSITGVGFQPDIVWIKKRTGGTASHSLSDSSRGNNLIVQTNEVSAEASGQITLDADGFTIGNGNALRNSTGAAYCAWCWKVDGGTKTSNTDGTITSNVQVNQKTGISIITYTGNGSSGATIGHGLSSAPEMLWSRRLNGSAAWGVYNKYNTGSPAGQRLKLDTDDATLTTNDYWAGVEPTSSVFSVGTENAVNINGEDYIMYAFHSIAGYSKLNTYTGNGSATAGPIVNTGFEPAYVMIKRTDGQDDWIVVDKFRSPSNSRYNYLMPNSNAEENGSASGTINPLVNFLTNGFQIAATWGAVNGNGSTYIYMAFASDPSATPVLGDSFYNKLYTGTGSPQSINGLGFSPSLVWLKSRNQVNKNVWTDLVRGIYKQLFSDSTDAQSTSTDRLIAFNPDGFTLNSGGTFNRTNNSGTTYVAWNWKANPIPSSNTDGTIQSIVSANQAAGFSIVKYTGDGTSGSTVGHNLGTTPEVVIYKRLDATASWIFKSTLLNTDDYLALNLTDQVFSDSGVFWNGTAPTSTVFTLGNSASVNTSSAEYIAYCFDAISGFSKFGTYTGNGSTQSITGLGFQPSWLLIKNMDSARGWQMFDSSRGANQLLFANSDSDESSEAAGTSLSSFDSDGFTVGSGNGVNESGDSLLYMAFKENPSTPAAIPAGEVAYLVVAAGGGAGGVGGGGGAGGLRTSYGNYTGGGLAAESNITLSAQTYTITIGGGGTASATGGSFNNDGATGSNGTNSVFGTITSFGGGGGTGASNIAQSGGSGGGARYVNPGKGIYGQGFEGVTGDIGGGGGGAGGAGLSSTAGSCGANGGPGLNVPITGTTTYYAGGGAGGVSFASGCSASSGGIGGGGDAGANAGTANTGGGGGGGSWTNNANYTTQGGGNGGSGVVILRMNTSDYSGTTTGSPTVTTDGSETILTYTGSGTYVHS